MNIQAIRPYTPSFSGKGNVERLGNQITDTVSDINDVLDTTRKDEAAVGVVGAAGISAKIASKMQNTGKIAKGLKGEIAEQTMKNTDKLKKVLTKAASNMPKPIAKILESKTLAKIASPLLGIGAVAMVGMQLLNVFDFANDKTEIA